MNTKMLKFVTHGIIVSLYEYIDFVNRRKKVTGNFYQMPNNIFSFNLNKYELSVYSYLVCCAGKKKECWPSLTTISRVLGISRGSAVKAIDKLVQLRLIDRIQVMKENKNGMMVMRNNHYLILPFDDAWEFFINNGIYH